MDRQADQKYLVHCRRLLSLAYLNKMQQLKLILNKIYNYYNIQNMNPHQDSLRSLFKQFLTKTIDLPTRAQAIKQIQNLITQNKTTNNLRIFLSVLSQNRPKHQQSELTVIAIIIRLYGKGLLDPLDKIPSLQKTVFRVTEIIMKYFGENEEKSRKENIMVACQKAWLELYDVTLKDEPTEIKKKLLYNSLQAIINGGGGKIAQVTAQYVIDGLLERALSSEDYELFKEMAKRVLVLFKKTTVFHPSSLVCLQTIIGFFNIMNLLPLLDLLIDKILFYVANVNTQTNSNSYKIKGEACNCLAVIGEQIDRNGIKVYDRVIKVLNDMATDKVWAIQAPGRKAQTIWRNKKKQWDEQFEEKQQKIFNEEMQVKFQSIKNIQENVSEFPKTYNNGWNLNPSKIIEEKQSPTHQGWVSAQNFNRGIRQKERQQNQKYLMKNTGMGGGNNIQSVENYYERQKPEITHMKKMDEIKKSIYQAKGDIQFEDTVDFNQQRNYEQKNGSKPANQPVNEEESENEADDFIQMWDIVLDFAERGKFEESGQKLLEMDDDLYFLRFFMKYSSAVLGQMTRSTSKKILKKMLQIKKTNFMEQMLFKLASQSIKCNIGRLLSNGQNLQIINYLQNAGKVKKLSPISEKLTSAYQNSLDQ